MKSYYNKSTKHSKQLEAEIRIKRCGIVSLTFGSIILGIILLGKIFPHLPILRYDSIMLGFIAAVILYLGVAICAVCLILTLTTTIARGTKFSKYHLFAALGFIFSLSFPCVFLLS